MKLFTVAFADESTVYVIAESAVKAIETVLHNKECSIERTDVEVRCLAEFDQKIPRERNRVLIQKDYFIECRAAMKEAVR